MASLYGQSLKTVSGLFAHIKSAQSKTNITNSDVLETRLKTQICLILMSKRSLSGPLMSRRQISDEHLSDPCRTLIGPRLQWLPTYTYFVEPKSSAPLKHRSDLPEANHPCWTPKKPLLDPCYLGCRPTTKYLIQILVTPFFLILRFNPSPECADGGLSNLLNQTDSG